MGYPISRYARETLIKLLNSEDACLILANEMNMSRF
jgi:hypothetical protein